jgi:arabinogalactan oligomer/maltooligosaccharide transport system permease protein
MANNMKSLKKQLKEQEKLANKEKAQALKESKEKRANEIALLLNEARELRKEAKILKKDDKALADDKLSLAKELEENARNIKNSGKKSLGIKTSRRIGNFVIYTLLIAMTVIWLAPFVGIVLESFKAETTMQTPYLLPKEWGLKHYIRLFTETDFMKWFINTAIMGVATAVLQTVFVLAMSYVLSRMRFKGRKALMNFMLILGMFPGFLTMILIYKVFSDAGLTMNMAPLGLIIVYCASSAMGYYVSKGFFDTIPKSLDEAARVDGATRFQVFYKVIMPLSKPIVIYTVLMGFMAPWGDFMMASYLIHENSQGMNVAVGMFEWLSRTNLNSYYTMFCAAGVIVAIPVVIVFLALQKYYVEGVTGGAVKG